MVQTATVEMEGSVGVGQVAQLHASVRDALEQNAELHIECGTADDIDTSILQLMMATRVAADQRGCRATFDNVSEYLTQVIEDLGVMYLLRHDNRHG